MYSIVGKEGTPVPPDTPTTGPFPVLGLARPAAGQAGWHGRLRAEAWGSKTGLAQKRKVSKQYCV